MCSGCLHCSLHNTQCTMCAHLIHKTAVHTHTRHTTLSCVVLYAHIYRWCVCIYIYSSAHTRLRCRHLIHSTAVQTPDTHDCVVYEHCSAHTRHTRLRADRPRREPVHGCVWCIVSFTLFNVYMQMDAPLFSARWGFRRALCTFKRAPCTFKRALCVFKRALCVFKRALCTFK